MNPALWQTWWALVAYSLLLTAVVIVAYRAHSRKTQQTTRDRYTEDLTLIQERMNEAQRIASIGNWDWNTVTDELWWSDEVYRLFQLNPDEFDATYQAFMKRVHPEDRELVRRAIERALHDQEPYCLDLRIIRRDGTERWVHARAKVFFDDEGTPVRMAGTAHDITERKLADDNIRHGAEYQALLARLSSDLNWARPEDINQQLSDSLAKVGARYDLDAMSIWWVTDDRDSMRSLHRWVRVENEKRQVQLSRAEYPWIAERLLEGKPIIVDDITTLPSSAAKDRKLFDQRGTKSFLMIPLSVDEQLEGACVFSMFREKRTWSEETVTELKLIAENLAGAVSRWRAVAEIKALKEQLQDENLYLREEVRVAHGFDEVIGEDSQLKQCLLAVEKVAPTDIPVLILGETGTGKELIARAVHNLSARRDRPMVSVNCPTLPADIIESELFGHEKGAFTGAQSRRRGRFELADTGTIFLDEVGELPFELQSKLLRVLQTGGFERLGGTETIYSDVRLIAATNRDLHEAQEDGLFRSDLYYRISSFPIRLPPLRDRKGDIPLLAEHFVHKHAERLGKEINEISGRMIRDLVSYTWPGNVRELESTIERALISSNGSMVLELPDALPWKTSGRQIESELSLDEDIGLYTIERAHIVNVLDKTQWKIAGKGGAAYVLGIPPSTLRSKMKRLNIARPAT